MNIHSWRACFHWCVLNRGLLHCPWDPEGAAGLLGESSSTEHIQEQVQGVPIEPVTHLFVEGIQEPGTEKKRPWAGACSLGSNLASIMSQ